MQKNKGTYYYNGYSGMKFVGTESNDYKTFDYGIVYGKGDKVCAIFDKQNCSLSYTVNNENQGILQSCLPDGQYRFSVLLYHPCDRIVLKQLYMR